MDIRQKEGRGSSHGIGHEARIIYLEHGYGGWSVIPLDRKSRVLCAMYLFRHFEVVLLERDRVHVFICVWRRGVYV